MLKPPNDKPKGPARTKAERRWRNHDLSARFKKMKATGEGTEQFSVYDGKKPFSTEVPKPPKEPEPVEPADLLEGKHDRRGSIVRAQTNFAKYIRETLEGHTQRNRLYYLISLEAKRKRLLVEKLRRLRLAQQDQDREQSNV
jgi:hypothetical protein